MDKPDSPMDCLLSGSLELAPLGVSLQLGWQGWALNICLRSVLSFMTLWAERSRRRAVYCTGVGNSAFSGKMARLFTVKTCLG